MEYKITFTDPELKSPRTISITEEQAFELRLAMKQAKMNEFVELPGYGSIKAIKIESIQTGTKEKRKPERLITYDFFDGRKQYRIVDWRLVGLSWEETFTDLDMVCDTEIERRLVRWLADKGRSYSADSALRIAKQLLDRHGEYVLDLAGKELARAKTYYKTHEELSRFVSSIETRTQIY